MTVPLGQGVELVTRPEWGARAPLSITKFKPSYGSTTHWEGPHMGWPWDHSRCPGKVRGIQAFHMDGRGWVDIAYTAVVCPHGVVYQGRWIGVRTAANGTNVGNSTAYATCAMWGERDDVPEDGRVALRVVQDHLRAHGGAGPGRNCHRDWKATACPGDILCAWVHADQPIIGGGIDHPPLPTPPPPEVHPLANLTPDQARQVQGIVVAGFAQAMETPGNHRQALLDLFAKGLTEDGPLRLAFYDLVRTALYDSLLRPVDADADGHTNDEAMDPVRRELAALIDERMFHVLTTGGHEVRTAVRRLAQMGANDAEADGTPPAAGGGQA